MSNIIIHAGDFGEGKAVLKKDIIGLPITEGKGFMNRDTIEATEITEIDIATEESVKRIGGTIGWGAAGAVVFGPVGLLAGLLLGGKKKEITFVAKFNDGKKMLATTDPKTYKQLMSIVMNKSN